MKTIKNFVFNIPNEESAATSFSREEQIHQLERVTKLISQADAVVVGIGSGMSSACGYNYYHETDFFNNHFKKYKERYGFNSLFFGLNHVYASPEEQWAFLSEYVNRMEKEQVGEAYLYLEKILENRNYFIITTNIDTQVSKIFPKERNWTFQGDARFFQCSQPCHDQIYENKETITSMVDTIHDFEVKSDLIPRCPYCGRRMILWTREESFLEGSYWDEQRKMYETFIQSNKDKRLVFLELGVGDMTPSIIKFPFWEMTHKMENAHLISINFSETNPPQHLAEKTVLVTMDLNEALKNLYEISRKAE